MPLQPASGGRVESLDVLRGLAAFAVVLFHVRVPLWVGWHALVADPSSTPADRLLAVMGPPMALFGNSVMLFFVVSGFAIHYPFAAPGAVLGLRSYTLKRFLRIYPPYAVAVFLTIAAERLMSMLGSGTPSSNGKALASLAMVQNYVSPIGQLTANPSLWSLPVEIELYLVYPLLLWFWRLAGLKAALALVACVSLAAGVAFAFGHSWTMGNFAKYWIIWVAGAALAERARTNTLPRWRTAYGLALIAGLVLAVAARAAGVPHGFEHFLWGAIYTLVVLWVLHRPDLLSRLPRPVTSALLWLGRISYSLYLIHFPLLMIIGACWVRAFGEKPTNILIPILASFATLPVAYVLWRGVERPSQLLAGRLGRRSLRLSGDPITVVPGK